MRFKVGDQVRCKPGGVEIWIHTGKVYEVLGVVTAPPEPGNKCYRDCGHPMHDFKPERHFVKVMGELGKEATILEDCFETLD